MKPPPFPRFFRDSKPGPFPLRSAFFNLPAYEVEIEVRL